MDVDTGDGEALQIACGAFNMAAGDLVPLATVGTVMPDGMEIGRRKMRGEWSNGMLCSARELGLGDDHAGILVLPPASPVGAAFAEAHGHRGRRPLRPRGQPQPPDAMSVAGVARDLAARLGVPFAIPEPAVAEVPAAHVADVSGRGRGPRPVRPLHRPGPAGVTVGQSDPTMARRLTLLGMRPINSLVDVSNYVMLELGQPNHPYDLAKVRGGGPAGPAGRGRRDAGDPRRRRAHVHRRRPADLRRRGPAIGIAGIMGGADTEIDATTTDVLLEMAWFLPIAIAKTSRRLRLRSEASARFEKGTDPEVIDLAIARFAELVAPSGARLEEGSVDVRGELPDRRPVPGAHGRGSTACWAPTSADGREGGCSSPSASPPRRWRATATSVTIPTWRYDSPPRSTWSRRWPASTATAGSASTLPPSAPPGG